MAIDVNNIVPSAVPKTAGLPVVKIGDHYFPVGVVSGGGGNADVEYGVINGEGNFQPLELADYPPTSDGDAIDAEIVMYDNGDYPDPVGTGQGKYRVRFFDYDGTILKTVYTDGGAVTAPAVPEHDRLLFQEWNNDFDNITDDLDVGAIYTTKSGKCEIDVWVTENQWEQTYQLPARTAYVGITLSSGTVTVEWGDGDTETLSTAGTTKVSHTYSNTGRYTILVSGTDKWNFDKYAFCSTASAVRNNAVKALYIAGIPSGSQKTDHAFANNYACELLTIDSSSPLALNSYGLLRNSEGLKHFNFPRSLKTHYWVLAGSCRMAHAVLPASTDMTEIMFGSFDNSGIVDIVIPKTVTKIGTNAFTGASGVQRYRKIVIPPKVTALEGGAFVALNCISSLATLIMQPSSPPTITLAPGWAQSTTTLPTDGSLKEIIVPAGCAEAYKSATNWSYYADIIREGEI